MNNLNLFRSVPPPFFFSIKRTRGQFSIAGFCYNLPSLRTPKKTWFHTTNERQALSLEEIIPRGWCFFSPISLRGLYLVFFKNYDNICLNPKSGSINCSGFAQCGIYYSIELRWAVQLMHMFCGGDWSFLRANYCCRKNGTPISQTRVKIKTP